MTTTNKAMPSQTQSIPLTTTANNLVFDKNGSLIAMSGRFVKKKVSQ